jgi:hypothetical protein
MPGASRRERRRDLGVDLVGRAGQRGESLDLLGVGDLDRPALLLERRVDRRAPVIDSITAQTGSRWTSSIRRARVLQRVDVGRDGELIEVASFVG